MTESEVAELLVGAGVVKTNFKDPFVWTSGIKSPIYTDGRLLIGLPGQRSDLIKALIRKIETLTEQPHAVAGTATAGIPWAAWVADRLGRPMLYVRKKPKGHGGGKQVEGCVDDRCHKILVVEDAISTGGSAVAAVGAIRREFDAQVTDVVSLFSWDLPGAIENQKKHDVAFHSLTNFTSIAEALMTMGQITEDEKAQLYAFHATLSAQ